MNHAGTIAAEPLLETAEADWERLMNITAKSMFLKNCAFLSSEIKALEGLVPLISALLELHCRRPASATLAG